MKLRKQYRCWLDIYYDLFPKKSFILVSLGTGILIYIIGLFLSLLGRFLHLYVTTYQVYCLILGIIWVTTCMRWGSIYFFNVVEKILHQYNFPQEKKSELLADDLNLITNNRLLIFVSTLLAISFYIAIFIFWIRDYRPFGHTFYLPKFLPQEWYEEPGIIFKYIAIYSGITEVSFLIGTSGTQFLIFSFRTMKALSKKLVFTVPKIAAEAFRPFGDLCLKASISWFIGIAIMMVAGFRGFSPLIWAYLSFFILVGFFGFFLPQYFIHKSLNERKNNLSDSFGGKYEKFMEEQKDIWDENYKNVSTFKDIFFINSVYSDIITSKTWVFDFSMIAKLIASALIPIASLFVKEWILKLL